jgi:hypothetical protein
VTDVDKILVILVILVYRGPSHMHEHKMMMPSVAAEIRQWRQNEEGNSHRFRAIALEISKQNFLNLFLRPTYRNCGEKFSG